MNDLHPGVKRLLLGRLSPGVWSIAALDAASTSTAVRHGWLLHEVDLSNLIDEAQLRDAVAATFAFHDCFGPTWAAVYDGLTDRAWPAGSRVMLVLRGGASTPLERDLPTLVRLLDDAADWWLHRGTSFVTVMVGDDRGPTLDYWLGLDDPEHPPIA